jgi:hypothetical protein
MAKKGEFSMVRFQLPALVTRPNHTTTKAEKRSIIEYGKQQRVISQERDKAIQINRGIGDINHSRVATFAETSDRMWEIYEQPRHSDLQAIVKKVMIDAMEEMDSQLSYATAIGSGQLIAIGQRSTYEETVTEEVGWFRKRTREK